MKAVMFHDRGSSQEQSERQRRHRRAGDVHDGRLSNQSRKLPQPRLANDAEGSGTIVPIPRRRWCNQGDFKFGRAIRIAEFCQAPGKRKHDRFDATDTRSKKVRVNEEPHSRSFGVAVGVACVAEESATADPAGRPTRSTAIRTASIVAAIFRSGDHIWMCANAARATDCK